MAKDYLTPLQVGANIGASYTQGKMAREELDLKKGQLQREQDAATAITGVYQDEAQQAQKRASGAKVLAQFRNLGSQSPSVRKSTAPVIFDAMNQAGLPIADNMKQFIQTGKTEEVVPVVDSMIRMYASDPNRTIDDLAPYLTNPLQASQAIGGLSRQAANAQEREAILGPTPNPRRDKFMEMKATKERQIAKLSQVVAKFGDTKTSEVAQKKIDVLRGELEKMETVLSSQEANAQGIPVRPGTVLTETGAGNISVLQGPDTHGGGSGSRALKATDERFLRTLAAAPYETEVNLQTGEIHFKNRADEIAANQVTAQAARAYLDAGGKLTLSEAYQQAIKSGAAPGGGTPAGAQVDPATGQPRNHFAQYDQ